MFWNKINLDFMCCAWLLEKKYVKCVLLTCEWKSRFAIFLWKQLSRNKNYASVCETFIDGIRFTLIEITNGLKDICIGWLRWDKTQLNVKHLWKSDLIQCKMKRVTNQMSIVKRIVCMNYKHLYQQLRLSRELTQLIATIYKWLCWMLKTTLEIKLMT